MSDVSPQIIKEVTYPWLAPRYCLGYGSGRFFQFLTSYASGTEIWMYSSDTGIAGSWVYDDSLNEPPDTNAPAGCAVIADACWVLIDDPADSYTLKLYTFYFATRVWALLSDSGISGTAAGTNMDIQLQSDGDLLVIYNTSPTQSYAVYDISGNSWGSPVDIGHTVTRSFRDSSGLIHFWRGEGDPVELHHFVWSGGSEVLDETVWTAPASASPSVIDFTYPPIEAFGKVFIGFAHWATASSSSQRPAVAYCDVGATTATSVVSVVDNSTQPAPQGQFLLMVGGNLRCVWIQQSGDPIDGLTSIYYQEMGAGLTWGGTNIQYYDYYNYSPQPQSSYNLDHRFAGPMFCIEKTGFNEHDMAVTCNFSVDPENGLDDMTAEFFIVLCPPTPGGEGCLYAGY